MNTINYQFLKKDGGLFYAKVETDEAGNQNILSETLFGHEDEVIRRLDETIDADLDDLPCLEDVELGEDLFIVDRFIPENTVGHFAGESNGGKSWAGLHLADHIARGANWLGFKVERRDVLYLDRENTARRVLKRRKLMRLERNPSLTIVTGQKLKEGIPTAHEFELSSQLVEKWASKHQGGVIFVDTMIRWIPDGLSENSNEDMSKYLRWAVQLRDKYGVTVIFLHHSGKGESTRDGRGASDIKGIADWAYRFEGHEVVRGEERNLEHIAMFCFKNREGQIASIGLDMTQDCRFTRVPARVKTREKTSAKQHNADEIVSELIDKHPNKPIGYVSNAAARKKVDPRLTEQIYPEIKERRFRQYASGDSKVTQNSAEKWASDNGVGRNEVRAWFKQIKADTQPVFDGMEPEAEVIQ